MAGRFVVDASVAAKLYFAEEGCDLAVTALQKADDLIAPDLLFVEMASIAAKNVRLGLAGMGVTALAVHSMMTVLGEIVPSSQLAQRAFELAATHGFSAYDGTYIALAEVRQFRVLTADLRLVRRAREVGFGPHLVSLAPAE